jgi:DNA-binding transcriptional LysR family regulator
VELESMSAAARALGVSKAVISKYVAALEAELGARLLHRTTRSVQPTATGRAVYTRARALLEQLHDLEAAARTEKEQPVGRLRVSAPVAFGQLQLAQPLSRFMRRYPAVSVELSLADRYVRLADEGIDVAIRVAARLEDEDVIARRLAASSMIACASPAYLRRRGRPRTPRDLASHTCIAFSGSEMSNRVPWRFSDEPADEPVWIAPAHRVDNSLLLRDLACSGSGIAFLLWFVAEGALTSGQLVPLFKGAASEERAIHAVYPAPLHASAKVRAFVRSLEAAYRGVSWG